MPVKLMKNIDGIFSRIGPIAVVVGLMPGLLIAGCADRNATSSQASNQAETTAQLRGEHDGEQRRDSRLETVDDEAAADHLSIDGDRLSDQAREQVGQSPVPVLLPDDDGLLQNAHLTLGDAWYVASMSDDDHTVVFNGTRRAHLEPRHGAAKEGHDEGRDIDHNLTRTHGIVSLSFEAFGVAYAIDVECAKPLHDERCTENDYVISMAEEAGLVEESR